MTAKDVYANFMRKQAGDGLKQYVHDNFMSKEDAHRYFIPKDYVTQTSLTQDQCEWSVTTCPPNKFATKVEMTNGSAKLLCCGLKLG